MGVWEKIELAMIAILPALVVIAWLLERRDLAKSKSAWEEVGEQTGLKYAGIKGERPELRGVYRGYRVRVWTRRQVEGSGKAQEEVFYTELSVIAQEEALGSVQVYMLRRDEIPKQLRKQPLSFATAFEVTGDELGRKVFLDEGVRRAFMELKSSGGDVLFGAGRLSRDKRVLFTDPMELLSYIDRAVDVADRLDITARRYLGVVEELEEDAFSTGAW